MIAWLFSSRSPAFKVTGQYVLLPLVCTVGLTLVFVGYYNWRVTGNALSFTARVLRHPIHQL
jgi:hypothetical protein